MDVEESHPPPPANLGEGGSSPGTPRWGWMVFLAVLAAAGAAVYFGRRSIQHSLGFGAVCGNGRVETGEACDDGNQIAEDACLPSCRVSSCGDGIKRAHVEECDDGNRSDGDGCSSGCLACPTNESSFSSRDNGHCYWREESAPSYAEASAACARNRGYLATYGTDIEWREVTERLLAKSATPAWIGLRQEELNGVRDFAWVTGERLLFSHWAIHEPRRDERHACVAQSGAGTWHAVPCDEPRGFVCERPRWTRLLHPTRAYRRFAEAATWERAAATCAEAGARLVVFDSGQQQERVWRRFPGPIWIGARYDGKTGEFGWVNGDPMTYTDFAPGEPDLLRFQHCVALDIDGRWYNRDCSDRNRFICEIP